MRKTLEKYLLKNGFFPLSSNVSDISALVKVENNLLNILQIIDYKRDLYLDKAQFEEIKASLRGAFSEKGVSEIHILTLILAEDIEKGESLSEEDAFCWLIDKQEPRLLIEEDKQPDFYGMKALIEGFLVKWSENPAWLEEESPEEHTKTTKKEIVTGYLKKAPYVTLGVIILLVIILLLIFSCILITKNKKLKKIVETNNINYEEELPIKKEEMLEEETLLTSLHNDQKGLEYEIDKEKFISQKVDMVIEMVAHMNEQMTMQFGKIDEKFAQIDKRFDQIDERFDRMEERLNNVENRLANVEDRLVNVEYRLTSVESNQEGLRQQISMVSEALATAYAHAPQACA